MLPECREGQDSSVVINMAATSTDGIVGTRRIASEAVAFVRLPGPDERVMDSHPT
jgi:hypothetical protein